LILTRKIEIYSKTDNLKFRDEIHGDLLKYRQKHHIEEKESNTTQPTTQTSIKINSSEITQYNSIENNSTSQEPVKVVDQLNNLVKMGFKNVNLNLLILQKNNGNFEQTINELVQSLNTEYKMDTEDS